MCIYEFVDVDDGVRTGVSESRDDRKWCLVDIRICVHTMHTMHKCVSIYAYVNIYNAMDMGECFHVIEVAVRVLLFTPTLVGVGVNACKCKYTRKK